MSSILGWCSWCLEQFDHLKGRFLSCLQSLGLNYVNLVLLSKKDGFTNYRNGLRTRLLITPKSKFWITNEVYYVWYLSARFGQNISDFFEIPSLAQCLTWYYGYFLGYLLGSIQTFLPAVAWETLVSPNHTNENILRYRC